MALTAEQQPVQSSVSLGDLKDCEAAEIQKTESTQSPLPSLEPQEEPTPVSVPTGGQCDTEDKHRSTSGEDERQTPELHQSITPQLLPLEAPMALTLDSQEYPQGSVAADNQKAETAHSAFQRQEEPAPVSVSIKEDKQPSMFGEDEIRKPLRTEPTGRFARAEGRLGLSFGQFKNSIKSIEDGELCILDFERRLDEKFPPKTPDQPSLEQPSESSSGELQSNLNEVA